MNDTDQPTPTPEEAKAAANAARASGEEATPAQPPEDASTEAPAEAQPERLPLSPSGEALQTQAIEVLRTIYDPEIPVDIYELGLIYEVNVDEETKKVHIVMTLTSPTCPVAESLPGDVEMKVKEVPGIEDVDVQLVWDPPWTMDLLSDAAKLTMGLG